MASSPTDSADKVFPPFDPTTVPSQLLWLIVTFGLFYVVMSRFALPRIGSILEMRSDRIAQDFDEAERLSQEADAAREAYESELSSARSRAHEIASSARESAKADLAEKRAKVEAELSKKLLDAEAHIRDVRDRGLSEVDSIASEISSSIVDAVLDGGRS